VNRGVVIIIACAALGIVLAVALLTGGDDDPAVETAERQEKPEVEVPEGAPPDDLVVEDIEEGDGPTAEQGDQVVVDYVGVDYETGEEFDASFGQPDPFEFALGGGMVIPGWDEGVEGMQVGGRRQLVIPPDLAYGKQGQPPAIKPNATLVFVIDLLEVREGQSPAG
jgi:peptidylprolyl isomerase